MQKHIPSPLKPDIPSVLFKMVAFLREMSYELFPPHLPWEWPEAGSTTKTLINMFIVLMQAAWFWSSLVLQQEILGHFQEWHWSFSFAYCHTSSTHRQRYGQVKTHPHNQGNNVLLCTGHTFFPHNFQSWSACPSRGKKGRHLMVLIWPHMWPGY